MSVIRRNTRFGAYGVDTPANQKNYSKPKLFRRLPHYGLCPCQDCDAIRQEHSAVRVMLNWPPAYPPAFYSGVNWEDWPYG